MAISGGLTTEDLKRMAQFYYKYTTAQLPAAIASDPRMSELQNAARASGLNFSSLLERVPVNRAGTVLPAATSFLSQYGSKLTPIQAPATASIKPTVQPEPLDPMAGDVLAKLANIYWTQPWDTMRQTVANDPQLRGVWDQIGRAGFDPEVFMRDLPYNKGGQLVSTQKSVFDRKYGAALATGGVGGVGSPSAQTAQLVKAAEGQQLISPTGPSKYSVGATTPFAPVTPGGSPQNALTGGPKTPVNAPLAQQVRPVDLSKTGVSVGQGGQTLTTSAATPSTAKTSAPITAPASQQTTVDIRTGLNQFYPQMVKENLEELQLARLPVGELVTAEQGRLKNLGNQPKADVQTQTSEMLQSPHRIRQQALERFRAGTLKPSV